MQATALRPARGRFLHLIPDDKFIGAVHDIFEESRSGVHDYLLISHTPPSYVDNFDPIRMRVDQVLSRQFPTMLAGYSAVFVHYLTAPARLLLAMAPASTRFTWLGWGADYYHLIHSRDELLMPTTQAMLSGPLAKRMQRHHAHGSISRRIRYLNAPQHTIRLLRANRLLSRVDAGQRDELKLIDRFVGMATPIMEDHAAIHRRHPELQVPFLDWNYWIEGFDAHLCPMAPTDNHVLLGNSATPENNHLEVLDILAECLPANRKIICPLSYGNKAYGDAVEYHGMELFGDRFVALRDYMPSESYAAIVSNCSIVIMNHIRQQALGNIVLALCGGARVFLNRQSPINTALKRMNIDVNAIESLPAWFDTAATARIDQTELAQVRKNLNEHFGRNSILRRTRAMLTQLLREE